MSETRTRLSRRDFLKLAGGALAPLAPKGPESPWEKTAIISINLFNTRFKAGEYKNGDISRISVEGESLSINTAISVGREGVFGITWVGDGGKVEEVKLRADPVMADNSFLKMKVELGFGDEPPKTLNLLGFKYPDVAFQSGSGMSAGTFGFEVLPGTEIRVRIEGRKNDPSGQSLVAKIIEIKAPLTPQTTLINHEILDEPNSKRR